MAVSLLDSLDHFCFHDPRLQTHHHPNLHHCIEKDCPGAISEDMAAKAGLTDENGDVKCPCCGCDTYPKGEWKEVDVHVDLCTDQTIHYPRMYRAGKLPKADYDAWKSTLTAEELRGYYNRVPHQHVVAKLHRDEAALIDTDKDAFMKIVNQKVRDAAERKLLFQTPYLHRTTTEKTRIPAK